jgi:hypothetical protein
VEELNEPSGWVTILPPRPEGEGGTENVLRTHFIQVAILANHQNGRDTHIRQIKICTRGKEASGRGTVACARHDPPVSSLATVCPRCLGRHAATAPRPAHVPAGVQLHRLPAVRLDPMMCAWWHARCSSFCAEERFLCGASPMDGRAPWRSAPCLGRAFDCRDHCGALREA